MDMDTAGAKSMYKCTGRARTSLSLHREDIFVQIDDHIYEVCKPPGTPSIEIVFFHDLQFPDEEEALKTWVSNDECWLKWLLDRCTDARILIISYDASIKKSHDRGRYDAHMIVGNLLQCFTGKAQVGQGDAPVVLVGHGVGALIIKELCVYAQSRLGLENVIDVDDFLTNVKGCFFYGPPNQGSRWDDKNAKSLGGPLVQDATTLNPRISRLMGDFNKLRKKRKWKISTVGETHAITRGDFKDVAVPEASARVDTDDYYSVAGDHLSICKPASRTSSSFQRLEDFIVTFLKQETAIANGSSSSSAVAMEARVKIVECKMQHCRPLGIVGMGGIGKSTLAEAVFSKMSKQFDYACIFREVKKVVSKKVGPEDLRAKILDRICDKKGRNVNGEGREFSWSKMRGKKVLLVMDDVESAEQVCVMTKPDAFHEESRLIVTSRNRGLLETEEFEIYEVETLNDQEAESLFCRHAFRDEEITEDEDERTPRACDDDASLVQRTDAIVTKLVKKCAGLPLTLEVVGSYLYRKKEDIWEETLYRLIGAQSIDGSADDELWARLRVSYDSMAPDIQEMFLDVATCFHGISVDSAKAAWSVSRWAAKCTESGWQILLDMCLVKEMLSDREKTVFMHEQLRDLGCGIAWPNGRDVEGYSRLCMESPSRQPHEENAMVKCLRAGGCYDYEHISLLTNLEILLLISMRRGWHMSNPIPIDPPLPIQVAYVHISSSSGEAMDILRLLEIKSLRGLTLEDFTLSLQPARCSAVASKLLVSLEHLILDKVQFVDDDDDDVNRTNLDVGFTNLPSLQRLVFHKIRMRRFSKSFGQYEKLQHLRISWSDFEIPKSFWDLPNLKVLIIQGCYGFKVSRDCILRLRALQRILICKSGSVEGCHELYRTRKMMTDEPRLPCESGVLCLRPIERIDTKLWKILRGSGLVSHLRGDALDAAKQLPEVLLELTMTGYTSVGDLIIGNVPAELVGLLPTLKSLKIADCGFEGWPDSLGQLLQALVHLEIRCQSLKTLPDSLGQLQALVHLEIRCWSLETLPDSLGQLQALIHLEIDCDSLQALPDSLGQLQALVHLEIRCCSLKTLPDSLGQLQALVHLEIGCRSLQVLPDSLGQLQALVHLEIRCRSLETLPDSLGQLQALVHLEIDCPELQALPNSLGQLQALVHLEIDCPELQALPNSLGQLQALVHLEIDCPELQALPNSLGQLQALVHLEIRCWFLETLPDSLGQLQALVHLEIDCPELQACPILWGNCKHLYTWK